MFWLDFKSYLGGSAYDFLLFGTAMLQVFS